MDSIKCDSTKCYYQRHGECCCTMDSYCKYRDSMCWDKVQSKKEAMVDYINSTPFTTVGELIAFLETQDASLPIAISWAIIALMFNIRYCPFWCIDFGFVWIYQFHCKNPFLKKKQESSRW